MAAMSCDLNQSMQHLVSKNKEEDVADEEVPTEDSLHRSRTPLVMICERFAQCNVVRHGMQTISQRSIVA